MKYHWNKLFGIADDTWEYNEASLRLCPESLWRCRRRRVDVIIGRLGGMMQGNGVLEVNGSLSRLRSPLRLGPRQAGLSFLSFLSRVSLSLSLFPDPSYLDCAASLHLFLFRFHAVTPEKLPFGFPLVDQYLMILLNREIVNNYLWKRHVIEGVNVISELEISR